ncbi:alpha/beta fold hydrolase [Dyadobacter chenhuakuii]|uniref:Alpha/beta hydrolase n=1 Tax=Dyadobacter chenhuakuii TaxID=2909339 RepID=A0ABY4XLE9_9BACT|nr:alpha/beta hydrolase [Dyadobacter chenhuakuii]MCF2494138.1 alpha/beta hydrolase [Dyadobacter chenhuakuii]USJ31266.1 alpha/beta hydrolase [Dyadobacter chenhuakuii]
MKRLVYFFLFNLFVASCNRVEKPSSQTGIPIKYGSNHGKYVTIHNTKIYYEEYGKGIPLLLLHQGLGSIENLAGIIPELSKHYRVIAPDAPGHGRSEHADSLSGELLAEYNSQLIDQLKLDSAYVMGWSTGGNTALLLAANRPDKIKKVVSGASNSKASGLTDEARGLLKEYTIEAVKEDKDWLENYQRMNPEPEKWIKFWEDNQKAWEREIKIPDDKIASIEVPVLLIRGDRDMIKLGHTISIFEALRYGQLCVYPNIGHEMPDEKGETLCQIAIEFLNEKAVLSNASAK